MEPLENQDILLDENIQSLKQVISNLQELQKTDPSRDRAIAITNLQTGLLWLNTVPFTKG